ncbi:MAG: TRAP transporter substrate-binding protein DctP [Gammaproteobacteria bacterium]|nr:TRAP transporter substrate-binding protein DctP [Gammaproteobacteria bacterium]
MHRCALLLAMLALPLTGSAKEFEWRLAHYLPEDHFFAAEWLPQWVAAIESESQGRLRIVIHPNNTLLRLGDIAPGVRDGLAEVGFGPAPDAAALSVLGLPFIADSAGHGTRVAMRLLADGDLDEDLAGLHVVLLQTNAPSLVHSRGKPIRGPADMQGMRMRGATPGIRALLAALGATPIEGFLAPQVYGALRDGHVDGTVFPYEAMGVFRLAEQLDYHTEVFLFVSALGLFVSADALAALPADLQAVVRAHSGAKTALSAARAWDDEESRGRALAVAQGNTLIQPTSDERAAWRSAAGRYTDERLAALASRTDDPQRLLARIEALASAMRE